MSIKFSLQDVSPIASKIDSLKIEKKGKKWKIGKNRSSKLSDSANLSTTPLSSDNHPVKLPITLYAFGNRTSPRPPLEIDIGVDNGLVRPTQPPTGASTFADIQYAPLTGHYHKLEKGTELPSGLNVIADGKDVGGVYSLTHHTIYPTHPMPFTEFQEKFLACGWVYVGKKAI